MSLADKIAYIRGLADGMQFNTETNEGKLIMQIIEALSDTATELHALREEQDELSDYVDTIDEDLDALEKEVSGDVDFDDDEDDEDDDEEDDEDDEDEDDDEDVEYEDDEDDDDFASFFGCVCTECGGMFCVTSEDVEDAEKFICPHCGKKVDAKPMDIETVPMAEPADDEDGEE